MKDTNYQRLIRVFAEIRSQTDFWEKNPELERVAIEVVKDLECSMKLRLAIEAEKKRLGLEDREEHRYG